MSPLERSGAPEILRTFLLPGLLVCFCWLAVSAAAVFTIGHRIPQPGPGAPQEQIQRYTAILVRFDFWAVVLALGVLAMGVTSLLIWRDVKRQARLNLALKNDC